jgi:hypothetical protein
LSLFTRLLSRLGTDSIRFLVYAGRNKLGRTVEEVEYATAERVDDRRLYRCCGDIPPAEMETAYHGRDRARATA